MTKNNNLDHFKRNSAMLETNKAKGMFFYSRKTTLKVWIYMCHQLVLSISQFLTFFIDLVWHKIPINKLLRKKKKKEAY